MLNILSTLLLFACVQGLASAAAPAATGAAPATLAEARRNFSTALTPMANAPQKMPRPPARFFVRADYVSGKFKLPAFVTPDPKDGQRRAAVIWTDGGELDAVEPLWMSPSGSDLVNPLVKQGVVVMVPSLRGRGYGKTGAAEYFLGEADDLLAAAAHLATLPYVDPARIYLAGSGPGATLALLVVEQSTAFKEVFALEPAHEIDGYSDFVMPQEIKRLAVRERRLRSPIHWLHGIASPAHLIATRGTPGDSDSAAKLCAASRNAHLRCVFVSGVASIDLVEPTLRAVGKRIAGNTPVAQPLTGEQILAGQRR